MDARAIRYAKFGHRNVQGWLSKKAAMNIMQLAEIQEVHGITGGACEIGVHHGRLFILLCLLLRPDERALAVDLFGKQGENVDGSGHGSLERLKANLTRWGVDVSRITTLAENSMRLSPQRVQGTVGPVRIFSVDGGHTAEITHNDLSIAACTVRDGGLVILDDFMSPRWPGVTEGACQFMHEHRELAPIGYVSNKLVLTRGTSEPYRHVLRGEPVEMFGRPAVMARALSWRERVARSAMWRAVQAYRRKH
jgi:hypothetical protein